MSYLSQPYFYNVIPYNLIDDMYEYLVSGEITEVQSLYSILIKVYDKFPHYHEKLISRLLEYFTFYIYGEKCDILGLIKLLELFS